MSTQLHDVDPIETKEWLDALSSVLEYEGSERAQYLLESLVKYSRDKGIRMPHGTTTPYLNTVSVEDEKRHPWRPKTSNTASVHSFVGTLPLSFCARVKKIWNWVDTLHLSNQLPLCTKSVSTTSGKLKAKAKKAIWYSSKATLPWYLRTRVR